VCERHRERKRKKDRVLRSRDELKRLILILGDISNTHTLMNNTHAPSYPVKLSEMPIAI